jgi:Ser/Thr protein kinase RdoA (MazF antagonist)
MAAEPERGTLPERRRNELLRQVDWRFLLWGEEVPRAIDLAPGPDAEALALIASPAEPGRADLALAGFPSRAALRAAREALVPGAELVCRWRAPRLAGARRARRRLEAAGFTDVRLYWAGPLPHRPPQFWAPLDSAAAVAHLLATRPARSRAQTALRSLWRLAARAGVLAPLFAVARLAEGPGGSGGDEKETGVAAEAEAGARPYPSTPLLLLSGGHRSINKVVGLAIEEGRRTPSLAVKFARVAEAEPGLRHEAAVLERLAGERPGLTGVPRLRGRWRRAGRLAIAEEAVEGDSMLSLLTPASFEELAGRVSGVLVELVDGQRPGSEPGRRRRLVEQPLAWFEQSFGSALDAGLLPRARRLLEGLGEPPGACEHRDCSPWNLVVRAGGEPALLDWESAEPEGLAGLDLVYFLANCAFVLDGAIESGRTRQSYARLLDPGTAAGRVAARTIDDYSAATGIGAGDLRRLRLLCWIVHSRSDYRHLELDVAGRPSPEALRAAPFLGLVEEELRRDQDR